jgi:hypothetical protein
MLSFIFFPAFFFIPFYLIKSYFFYNIYTCDYKYIEEAEKVNHYYILEFDYSGKKINYLDELFDIIETYINSEYETEDDTINQKLIVTVREPIDKLLNNKMFKVTYI